jgi:hypothetical protein
LRWIPLPELTDIVARLRGALDEDPESLDYGQLRPPAPATAPAGLPDVLALTDGRRD